jgi:nitrate/nitrite transporter NarK
MTFLLLARSWRCSDRCGTSARWKSVWTFLLIYGLSYFFTEFGPNATTFVYPSEIFPVKVRTTAHGIAAALGKIGGFVGVFTFPFFMHGERPAGS